MKILSLLISFLLTVGVSSVEDLAGLKTAVLVGSVTDIGLSQEHPELDLRRFNTPSDMVRALDLGKVDVMLTDSTFLMSAGEDLGWLEMYFGGLYPAPVGMAFDYSSSELCKAFNDFLKLEKDSGRYDEIIARWSVPDYSSVSMPERSGDFDEVLNVGIVGGNIPFTFFAHEQFCGIEPELINSFASSIGRKVVYHEYEFGALWAALRTGRIDMAVSEICITPERAREVLFSDPYFYTSVVCIGRSGKTVARDSFFTGIKRSFYNNIIAEERYMLIWEGLENTIFMALFAAFFGTLLGALMAWRCFGPRKKIWHKVMKVYGSIMHGVPLLVLLLIMFYLILANTGFSSRVVAAITFTVYFTYACCEIFVSGVESVNPGQMMAAVSLGFTPFQSFRYVVFPQALKHIIPSYEAELVTVIKETCLAGFIAVVDLTKATDIIQSRTFDAFFPLIMGALIYFVICAIIAWGLKLFLKKMNKRC